MGLHPIGPLGAKILIVGDLPTEQDFLKGEPFIGGGGYELNKILNEAGTFREHVGMTLVLQDRVKGNSIEAVIATKKKDITASHILYRGKYVQQCVIDGVEELERHIRKVKPNVVVPVGNLALWALTGEWGVNNWRSSVMESTLVGGVKVIPTLPPSRVMVQWSTRPLVVHDFKRAVRESAYSEVKRADYSLVIRPDYETAVSTLTSLIIKAGEKETAGEKLEVGTDIETRAGHIACISFAWSETEAICIPLMCQHNVEGYWTLDEEAVLVGLMVELMRKVRVIGQNWNYDAQYIYRYWHFICPDVVDTMIQQHSCFSNLDKNLAFLSSMYCDDHLYWKDDRTNWTEGPKGEGENKSGFIIVLILSGRWRSKGFWIRWFLR